MLTANVTRWKGTIEEAFDQLQSAEPRIYDILRSVYLDADLLIRIILGIIQKESSGDPNAIGDGGASYGLMQLNYLARDAYSISRTTGFLYASAGRLILIDNANQLLSPYVNISIGIRYFVLQLAELQDVDAAILAYNAPLSTRRWLAGEIPSPINLPYLRLILSYLDLPEDYFRELPKKKRIPSFSGSSEE